MTRGLDTEERDPGLARERTALAWTRTAISVAALGGAILKANPPAGILVLAMSVPVWWLGRPLRREPPGPGNGRRLLLVTITVTMLSCAALVLTLRAGLPAGIAPQRSSLRASRGCTPDLPVGRIDQPGGGLVLHRGWPSLRLTLSRDGSVSAPWLR